MKLPGMLPIATATLLLAGPVLPRAALAQTPQQRLVYVQPLSSQAIRDVQQALRQQGAYQGNLDGIWGDDSAEALRRFQQTHGLQVTGTLDPGTVALLRLNPGTLVAASAPTPPPGQYQVPARLHPAVVRVIEEKLRADGFYHGAIDGIDGPHMHRALQQFQSTHGLQPTGELNPGTIAALGLNPNDLLASAHQQ